MKRIALSVAAGGLISALFSYAMNHGLDFLGVFLIPFYVLGVWASGKIHAPSEVVCYGSFWLTTSFAVWVMIVCRGRRAAEHGT